MNFIIKHVIDSKISGLRKIELVLWTNAVSPWDREYYVNCFKIDVYSERGGGAGYRNYNDALAAYASTLKNHNIIPYEIKTSQIPDCSGAYFGLYWDEARMRSWHIPYGHNKPEWQEDEKRARSKMLEELTAMGVGPDTCLNYDLINKA